MDKQIEILVKKAANAVTAEEAMKFSQAACNVAHVMRVLAETNKVE